MIGSRRDLIQAMGCALVPGCGWPRPGPDEAARARMVAEVERDARDTAMMTGRAALDPRVMAAIGRVPRHRFVPAAIRHRAYDNRPLPIGHEQTISQPFIVALMSDLAEVDANDRVLEVGTGSAYQAAILAELAERVYTIEIIAALGHQAAAVLRELGYVNVTTRIGDGYRGWPEAAPFNAIVVTAAPEQIPQPLIDQLAPGGRLVAPVGPVGGRQDLVVVRKDAAGSTVMRTIIAVQFVPLTRER